MSDDPAKSRSAEKLPPASEPPPPVSRRSRKPIVIGFLIGAWIWLMPWAVDLLQTNERYAALPFLLFACFVLPPVSLVLAIIRRTRRVGLGLLLACGLAWLILGAMCGGVFR